MELPSVRHRGLGRFVRVDDGSGLPAASIERIRNIVSFLQEMDGPDDLKALRRWSAHQLTGDRRGTWSRTVARNWRISFKVDEANEAIIDLNFEDYH
jgi:proteic killer suppression protein